MSLSSSVCSLNSVLCVCEVLLTAWSRKQNNWWLPKREEETAIFTPSPLLEWVGYPAGFGSFTGNHWTMSWNPYLLISWPQEHKAIFLALASAAQAVYWPPPSPWLPCEACNVKTLSPPWLLTPLCTVPLGGHCHSLWLSPILHSSFGIWFYLQELFQQCLWESLFPSSYRLKMYYWEYHFFL